MAGVANAVAARRAMGRRVPKIIATRSPLFHSFESVLRDL
jgi:signal recognition particle subunit SEC65